MEKISIVIPTYNEERDIENCIASLKKQTYKNTEIIVVDDGSTDRTLKILKKIRGIRLIKLNHLGPGAARNKGVRKAKGSILVFVDADMTFDKHFIDMLTLSIRQNKSIGTFSDEEYVSNNDNNWARNWSINRGWQAGKMHNKIPSKTQKVFRAIKKDKFDSVGGFDEKVGYTDDWSLAKKLKEEAIRAENALFYHRNPDNLKEIFTHAKWMAKRPYKLLIIGRMWAILRTNIIFSIIVGTYKAIRYKSPSFIVFKLVFDIGTFKGLSEMFIKKSRAK